MNDREDRNSESDRVVETFRRALAESDAEPRESEFVLAHEFAIAEHAELPADVDFLASDSDPPDRRDRD